MSGTDVQQDTSVQEETGEAVDAVDALAGSSEETTAAPNPSSDSAPAESDADGADGSPTPIALQAPEGAAVNSEFVDALTAFANEKGMTQEQAEGMLEMHVSQLSAYDEAAASHWQEQQAAWEAETAKDPAFKEFDAHSSLVFDRFGDDDLKALNESGLLKLPALKRLINEVGKALKEDSVSGSANGTAPVAKRDPLKELAAALYNDDTRSPG